jgi:hypothetical protein
LTQVCVFSLCIQTKCQDRNPLDCLQSSSAVGQPLRVRGPFFSRRSPAGPAILVVGNTVGCTLKKGVRTNYTNEVPLNEVLRKLLTGPVLVWNRGCGWFD